MLMYDSSRGHGMIATGGEPCAFLAVVMKPRRGRLSRRPTRADGETRPSPQPRVPHPVSTVPRESFVLSIFREDIIMRNINFRYVDEAYDEDGCSRRSRSTMPGNFNFGYDVVDDIATTIPTAGHGLVQPRGRGAHFHVRRYENVVGQDGELPGGQGIGRGDIVMVILRRHYQFWFAPPRWRSWAR